ncbi:MAG: glycoside hydrolase family 13 protein [Actinomycetota bacterium]|nr:glycoside hydrolase family 13 protein [Actinomycetota bacterium]
MSTAPTAGPWWRRAVCYQIYVRSFADSDGDGVGDLAGITSRLPYLAELGVDAIWLTPFYRSPQADHGYDVADYRDVDPRFGDLDDFDAMLARAHDLGLRVIVDVVPNHSSDEHAWFRAALSAGPGSPQRARYVFREGRGDQPPNNWQSVFGGPAWSQVPDGQWYLHLFDTRQPDFDWDNPEVGDEFESVLRFWLDRGVDGFRVDVAHGMVKQPGLPDLLGPVGGGDLEAAMSDTVRPYFDQPGVHDVYRRWNRLLAAYPGDRMAIGEAWVVDAAAMARYVRPDEMQQVFNFHWLEAPWSAAAFRSVIAETYAAVDPVGATPTWVLSNHDVTRVVTRYGGGGTGRSRARAAALAELALPGSAYVYQGEELGLEQVDVPEPARTDPSWFRGSGPGRDGCRVPMPWSGASEPYGFSPDGVATWLPMPSDWAGLSVACQSDDPHSTLSFYRRALAARRELLGALDDQLDVLDRGEDVLVLSRPGEPGLVCVLNCGAMAVPVGDLGEPVLTSERGAVIDGRLAPDSGAWFRA